MKPYFAKYLPVEGEIKTGSHVPVFKAGKLSHFQLETPEKLEKFKNLPSGAEIKPAKLYLCSRDTQVGDTIQYVGKEGNKFEASIWDVQQTGGRNAFKVIGEVSPEATWVKEGDEFDEYDYRCKDRHGWDIVKDISVISPRFRDLYFIGLKGPCGHFH